MALHNIAGLGTPDQVQMAMFALAYLMPSGSGYIQGTRAELATRLDALMAPLGIAAPGGQDSLYYALIDLLAVAQARAGWRSPSTSPSTSSRPRSRCGWPRRRA